MRNHVPLPTGFGLVNGQPLFLDLASDSYFLLPECGAAQFSCPDLQPQATASVLADPDTVVPTGARQARPAPITGSALDLPLPSASVSIAVQFWRELVRAKRDLARLPLAQLLEPFAVPRALTEPTTARCVAQACAVAGARDLIPQKRHCLTDSLALLRLLAKRELAATLVFGAKLDPFAAHCWVQAKGMLLNDHRDTVERFTPVLTLPA